MPIRVAVIEDHPLMLKAVVQELDGQNDIEVVGTADHGTELLSLARETCPDVVILAESHRTDDITRPMKQQPALPGKPVVIEDDVWIGIRVIILPGVNVHHGAILAAGAVLTAPAVDAV